MEMLDLLIRDSEAALIDIDRAKQHLEESLNAFKDAKMREVDALEIVPTESKLAISRDYLQRATTGLAAAGQVELRIRRMNDARNASMQHPFVQERGQRHGGRNDW
jgi:hypothetical protein